MSDVAGNILNMLRKATSGEDLGLRAVRERREAIEAHMRFKAQQAEEAARRGSEPVPNTMPPGLLDTEAEYGNWKLGPIRKVNELQGKATFIEVDPELRREMLIQHVTGGGIRG